MTYKQKKALERLIAESMAMEAQEAKEAGALGFMARAMTLATLPHRATKEPYFSRKNGHFTMTMTGVPHIGLPYGTVPRLLLSWVCTEAVRTKEPELVLGDSMSSFMRELDMLPTGGRWGSIPRLKTQTKRLFSCTISADYDDGQKTILQGHRIADQAVLWWDAKEPSQATIWNSTVTLSPAFYKEVIDHPIPVDLRALKALKQSPLALDLYVWLTHRMSYLGRRTEIPWGALRLQFGSDYSRLRDFKSALVKALSKVELVYPEAQLSTGKLGLVLKPSPTHVLR